MSGSISKLTKELKVLVEKKKNPKTAKVTRDVLQDEIKEKKKELDKLRGTSVKKPVRRSQRSKITDYFKPQQDDVAGKENESKQSSAQRQHSPSSDRRENATRDPLGPIINQLQPNESEEDASLDDN